MSIAEAIVAFSKKSAGWLRHPLAGDQHTAVPKLPKYSRGNKNGSHTKKGPGRYHLQGGSK